MKKSLFILGAAAMMFAGCAKENVTNVAENRAINFDSYVYNNTKAVTEVDQNTLKNYYVFGVFGNTPGTYTQKVFTNELQSALYYWTANNYYKFGAYADGENGQIQGVVFDAVKGELKFTDYAVNDTKDLVAAVSTEVHCTDPNTQQAVPLQFKHMLSQVKFTFNTKAGENYTIGVKNIKINAVTTADGVYNGTTSTWTEKTKTDVAFSAITDVAVAAQTAATEYKLVIPQETTTLTVTFTASVEGAGITPAVTKDFTVSIAYNTNQAWQPGFRYNYTAELNPENITKLVPITFTPTVEAWQDAAAQATPAVPAI